jgi:hypothetical protein
MEDHEYFWLLQQTVERVCQQVPGLGLTLDSSDYFAGPNH